MIFFSPFPFSHSSPPLSRYRFPFFFRVHAFFFCDLLYFLPLPFIIPFFVDKFAAHPISSIQFLPVFFHPYSYYFLFFTTENTGWSNADSSFPSPSPNPPSAFTQRGPRPPHPYPIVPFIFYPLFFFHFFYVSRFSLFFFIFSLYINR